MKALITVFGLAAAIVANVARADSRDGGVGNGGDHYAVEFTEIGRYIAEQLRANPIPQVDTEAFEGALAATRVESEERLFLDGHPKDAINYPDATPPRILVSREAWHRMAADLSQRDFLVFHEYLGILGIDDSTYAISSQLDRGGICSRSKAVKAEIEEHFHLPCDRLRPGDLRTMQNLVLSYSRDAIREGDLDGMTGLRLFSIGYVPGFESLSLPEGIFRDLRSLRRLHVSGLRIPELGPVAFKHLKGLDSIDLAKSSVGAIRSGAFSELGLVGELNLAGNPIETVQAGAWGGLNVTRRLNLTGGMLRGRELTRDLFDGLGAVGELNLEPSNSCRGPTRFTPEEKGIRRISSDALDGVGSIDEVTLCLDTLAGRFDADSFKSFSRVRRLNLAAYDPRALSPQALTHLTGMKVLDFRNGLPNSVFLGRLKEMGFKCDLGHDSVCVRD